MRSYLYDVLSYAAWTAERWRRYLLLAAPAIVVIGLHLEGVIP